MAAQASATPKTVWVDGIECEVVSTSRSAEDGLSVQVRYGDRYWWRSPSEYTV